MSEAPDALLEFEDACAGVLDAWAGSLLRPSSELEADVAAMSDDGLVRVTEALALARRRIEALQARCAAGLAERSRGAADDGGDLARRRGFASPERLIAQATGGRYSEAARLVAVGEATAKRASFTGAEVPAKRPYLAEGLHRGALCLDAADVIRRFLDRVALRAPADELDAAERFLVDRAPEVGVDGLARLVKQLEARLDPDGVEPREAEQRARRSLAIWEDASGMIMLRGALDPVNGAPVKLAIESLVGAELHRARGARRAFGTGGAELGARAGAGTAVDGAAGIEPDDDDAALVEERSIEQMNADALADLARRSLSAADAPAALRHTTVVVRVDAAALASGDGHATIDGIDQPVSVASARELIASCGIAPMLIGAKGEALALGRTVRLFTTAQKLALADRDGGCAWPGCRRPPSHAEAHHIRWWSRDHGATDVDNGVLLCSHHHHLVHREGWKIEIRDHRAWFTPPPHLDAEQRPRPGNIAVHRLSYARAAG